MTSIRRASLMAIFFVFFLAEVSLSQQVRGISGVLESTNASEIDGWSETDIDYNTAYYYDAAVAGYLFQDQDQTPKDSAVSSTDYDNSSYIWSGVETTTPVNQGSVYTIYSEHYLITYFITESGYYNYYQYPGGSYFSSPGGGDPTGTGYDPGSGLEYINQDTIYLGYTYFQFSTAPPSISNISPQSDIRGGSGTIHVQGQSLKDDLGRVTASFRDGDISANANTNTADASQVDVSYTISQSASIGTHQLVVSNTWGDSEPANFTVGYPPAIVTSVSPPVWVAGNDYDVTVTGTGFGGNPSVTAVAPGVASGAAYNSSPDGTTTYFHVHVEPNAPNEAVQVVVAPGYSGNNYICGNCNGGSGTGSSIVSVDAETPPSPIIKRDANTITGQTINVMAGEKISLTVAPPSGFTLNSQSWSFSGGIQDITGGFINSSGGQPNASSGLEAADPSTTNQDLTYYFVNPGTTDTVTVTVTYTLADGSTSQSVSSTATFSIDGPTGNILPNAFVQTDNSATTIADPQTGGAALQMRNAPTKPGAGVVVNDLATLPANPHRGQFIWVQIQNSVTYTQIVKNGVSYVPLTPALNQLDGNYPYPPSNDVSASDGPSRTLYSFFGEGDEAFDATMYVLWDPAIPPAGQTSCTPASIYTGTVPYTPAPSTCTSIPIPLGSVRWKWGACAINALAPVPSGGTSPSWFEHCGPGQSYQPVASGYPEWHSCHVSLNGGCQ